MRLSVKLAAVFALFGLGIAGGLMQRQLSVLRRETHAKAEDTAEITLTAVRALVEAQARADRLRDLGRDLEVLVRQTGIATVAVVDARGKVILRRVDNNALLRRKPEPGLPFARVKDGILDREASVNLGRRGRGVVSVGFRTTAIEERINRIEAQAFQASVAAFLFVTLAAAMAGAWFGGRLERLVPRLEALARDPLAFRPLSAGRGADELSRLITAFNAMGASLRAETERRRALEHDRKELSAMLVHDLKTPLTVVRSGITLLQEQLHDERDGAPFRRTFELLNMSADRLQRMVEDVLQLSRLEEIGDAPPDRPVDLAELARACGHDLGLIATDRKQKLEVDAPEGLGLPVRGDAALLRRVIDNLVSNAIEHTPSGGLIRIVARAEGGVARVEVIDSGPGVPPEVRGEIFRKFFQKDVKRYVGNVGLGLALCEKVVLRHGGAIAVTEAQPRGAKFFFTLPLASSAVENPAVAA